MFCKKENWGLWLLLRVDQFWDCVEGEDIIVVVDERNQENLHVVEEPMASLNVLIENENNAMLAYYAKKIGLAIKGITVSICEKSRCKNNRENCFRWIY